VVRAKLEDVVVDFVVEVWIIDELRLEVVVVCVCDRSKCDAVIQGKCVTDLHRKLQVPFLLAPARELDEVLFHVTTDDPAARKGQLDEVPPSQFTWVAQLALLALGRKPPSAITGGPDGPERATGTLPDAPVCGFHPRATNGASDKQARCSSGGQVKLAIR
jgi:hypothetical protein